MMNFEEFVEAVVTNIKDFLPENYKDSNVAVEKVEKNNGVILSGLSIKGDSNLVPAIYLEEFYEDYKNYVNLDAILQKIAEFRLSCEVTAVFDVDKILDFDNCKKKILPRLVNYELNKEMLKNKVFERVADLAVTYHIQFNSQASTIVTKELLDLWQVSVEKLHDLSFKNMKEISKSVFLPLYNVIQSLRQSEFEEIENLLPADNILFLLTNESKLNGAVNVFDEEIMKEVIDTVGPDFVILPSSKHEVLIVPVYKKEDIIELRDMVKEVNSSVVCLEDKLSDNVYRYEVGKGLVVW